MSVPGGKKTRGTISMMSVDLDDHEVEAAGRTNRVGVSPIVGASPVTEMGPGAFTNGSGRSPSSQFGLYSEQWSQHLSDPGQR